MYTTQPWPAQSYRLGPSLYLPPLPRTLPHTRPREVRRATPTHVRFAYRKREEGERELAERAARDLEQWRQ